MKIRLPFKIMALVAGVAIAAGCDESPTRASGLTGSAHFDIVGGGGQQAFAGTELPQPLAVRVMAGEVPVANQVVNFVVTAGGGHMYAGTALTNANGIAQDYWTLGEVIGSAQEVQVRAVNPSTGSAVVYGSFTATAHGPVETVTVTPDSTSIEESQSAQLSATLRDQGGLVLSDQDVAWSSSNPEIATIDAHGLLRALGAGTVTIRAMSDNRYGESRITVVSSSSGTATSPPATSITVPAIPSLRIGNSHQASVLDGNGQAVSMSLVQWQSSNSTVATVSAGGLVTARGAGDAVITATVEGQQAGAAVVVRPRGKK